MQPIWGALTDLQNLARPTLMKIFCNFDCLEFTTPKLWVKCDCDCVEYNVCPTNCVMHDQCCSSTAESWHEIQPGWMRICQYSQAEWHTHILVSSCTPNFTGYKTRFCNFIFYNCWCNETALNALNPPWNWAINKNYDEMVHASVGPFAAMTVRIFAGHSLANSTWVLAAICF